MDDPITNPAEPEESRLRRLAKRLFAEAHQQTESDNAEVVSWARTHGVDADDALRALKVGAEDVVDTADGDTGE